VDDFLPPLLAAGLVRRGYALTCDECFLRDWYGLDEFGEFVECHGCGRRYQLSDHHRLSFCYTANELARRFIREGGTAVLMAAALLEELDDSGVLQFGGDLAPVGQDAPFAEADILWLTKDEFAIVECKAFSEIDDARLAEMSQALERGMLASVRSRATVLMLAVATRSAEGERVRRLVAEFADRTANLPIGVHLILNGRLWVNGNLVEVQPDQTRRVRVSALGGVSPKQTRDAFEGDKAPSTIPGGVRPTISEEILREWDSLYATTSSEAAT
jgi:hypothetical protein